MNVVFVCTGNTCRSPMAEALLKCHSPEHDVKSAGIYAAQGEQANCHTLKVLGEVGIEFDHSSQNVTEEILTWADIVLTMTSAHKDILAMEQPGFQHKIRSIVEFTEGKHQDITDPFGGSIETYRATREELTRYIKKLNQKLGRN